MHRNRQCFVMQIHKYEGESMFEKLKLKRRISYLKKQIKNNDDDARYELAMIYLDGSIIKKDEKQALALLKTASNNGHLKSKAYLISNKAFDVINLGINAIDSIRQTLNN